MAVSHVKSITAADWTGTVTVRNSADATASVAATDLVRPSDWLSAHNQFFTLTGNTAGNSTASGTNVLLAGSGGIVLGGSTASIVIAKATKSGYNPYEDRALLVGQFANGSLVFDPVRMPNLQFDRAILVLHNTNSSNSSGSHTLSFWLGLYTRNASTLSLLVSTSSSTALTHSGTVGSYSLYSNPRLFTIPWTTTLTEGDHWIGFLSRTTSGGANGTYSNILVSNFNSNFVGHFGSSHNTTMQLTLGQGIYTATTSAMPNSIAFSELRGSDSIILRAPVIMFGSGTV